MQACFSTRDDNAIQLQRLCSQHETWHSALQSTSVSVLMFVMPSVKIYIKSYNATRSHAGDQGPLIV